MSELKPCPFCGESKLLYSGGCGFRYDDDDNQIRLFRVHCRTCKGRTGLFESLDEAVEAWNRRTNSTTIQPSALGTNLASLGTDCISRQQAIDTCMKYNGYGSVWACIMGDIKQLPSAQPEPLEECERCMMEHTDEMEKLEAELAMAQPKRGRWISADAIFGGVPFYCSECGENTRDTVMGKPRWNFCPNCGAKMEVEHE